VVPQLTFFQGKDAVLRAVQGLHFCGPQERLTQVLGTVWSAIKGLYVDGAHSLSEGCSCQAVVQVLSVSNEQIET